MLQFQPLPEERHPTSVRGRKISASAHPITEIASTLAKFESNGTVKKNIIDGMSRLEWLTGKLLATITIYTGVFLFGLLVYFTTGIFVEGLEVAYTNYDLNQMGRDFAIFLYQSVILFCIAILTRSVIVSFLIYLFIDLIESLIGYGLRQLLDSNLNFEQFLPMGSLYHLEVAPVASFWYLLVPVVYMALLMWFSSYNFHPFIKQKRLTKL